MTGRHAADDLLSSWFLRSRVDFVLDRLFELERSELRVDRRTVKEQVSPTGRRFDETESFVGVERVYFSSSLLATCQGDNDLLS